MSVKMAEHCEISGLEGTNLSSSQSLQFEQWPMVVIRDSHIDTVFPPAKHENLHDSSQFNHELQYPESPSSSFSLSSSLPSASSSSTDIDSLGAPSPEPRNSVVRSGGKVFRWLDFGVQILQSKFFGIISSFRLSGWAKGLVLSSRSALHAGLGVVLFWWFYAGHRWRKRQKESVDQLKMIIEQKNEKIIQLLRHISRMNEVLLAHHGVSVPKLAE